MRDKGAGKLSARLGLLENPALEQPSYLEWVRKNDTPTYWRNLMIVAEVRRLEKQPLISLILTEEVGDQARQLEIIESVRKQIYPHWQLWITSPALLVCETYLTKSTTTDPRIRIHATQITPSTNVINDMLSKIDGEYFISLDGKGKLSPHALYWIARKISVAPDAGFIYADEDRIDGMGKRSEPHFKPGWNPDLFLTWDYTGSFKVFSTNLARQLGGFRSNYNNSQRYEFSLRATERLKSNQICHIPRILYHQYVDADNSYGTLPQVMDGADKAVNDHLTRLGINTAISTADEIPNCLRVRYSLPEILPVVTLIIPTRNGVNLLQQCLESIKSKTDYPNYNIIIVDNGSDDPVALEYLSSLRKKPEFQVIRDDGPFNFSRLNNLAAKQARGTVLGFLNNDLEVINADWLSEMVSQALRPEIGIVGARLWYPDDTIQHAGVILADGVAGHAHKGLVRGNKGYFGRAALVQNFVAVTAACMIMEKKVFQDAGGLDEAFAVAFNDVDLCLRVTTLGYRNLWTPYAQLYHHESSSRGHEDTPQKMERFLNELNRLQMRWGTAMLIDPTYNPNLHSRLKDFSLAWPPVFSNAKRDRP